MDGYGRGDVLRQVHGFDNAPFLEFLNDRGFFVAENSQSNYMQTAMSMASTLNLGYLDDLAEFMGDSQDREPAKELVRRSRVRALLEEFGYQIVAISSGSLFTEITDSDIYLSRYSSAINEFEGLLLSISAAELLINGLSLDIPISDYGPHRERILYALEQLAEVPNISGPKFVFAHVLAPHPPFVFDQDGQPLQADRRYFPGDGTGFRGTPEEYVQGYTDELVYVNQLLKEAIDAILTNSAEPPIIILQGDHGPGAFLSWDSSEESCLWERFSILNAYFLPQGGSEQLYDAITPVNSFRAIFDTYFGTEMGLLEDKSYFSGWSDPYHFVDVSEQSRVECTLP
jgi:hypothetical protein